MRTELEMEFIFVLIVGLIAGAISGVIGTGSSIMLVPVLVWQFGPKEAVPIMAVGAGLANFPRIVAGGGEGGWGARAGYAPPRGPAARVGGQTPLLLPPRAGGGGGGGV